MLHVNTPKVRKVKRVSVEVPIDFEEPMDAKGFGWSVNRAIDAVRAEGSSKGNDDEFFVRIEGNELVFYFEKAKVSGDD